MKITDLQLILFRPVTFIQIHKQEKKARDGNWTTHYHIVRAIVAGKGGHGQTPTNRFKIYIVYSIKKNTNASGFLYSKSI